MTLAQGLCHSTTAMSQKLGPWWVRAVMIGKNWNTSDLRKLVWGCWKMGMSYDLPNSSLFGDDLVACSVRKRMADVHGQIRGCVLLYQLRGLTLALQVIVLKGFGLGLSAEVSTFCQVFWAREGDRKWHLHPKIGEKNKHFLDNYGLFFSLWNTYLDEDSWMVKIHLLILKGDLSSPN